jgi:hypothetical protein
MQRVAALIRAASAGIAIVVGGAGAAKASFIARSPDPFPPGSGFVHVSGGCAPSGLCSSNISGRILSSSDSFPGDDNEHVVLNEVLTADISNGGVPFGSFSALGTLSLTLFGRSSPGRLGTFSGAITDEDYRGSIDGLPFEITLDPSQPSSVQVTIALLPQTPLRYRIDVVFDNPSEISLGGGPPIPISGPPITDVLIPEPATTLLFGVPLAALAGLRRSGSAARYRAL